MPLARAAALLLLATAGCFRPAIFPARTLPAGLAPGEPVIQGGAALNLLPPAPGRPGHSPRPSFHAGSAGGLESGGALYGGLSWIGMQHAGDRVALPTFELAGAWTLLETPRFLVDAGGTAAIGLDALRSTPPPRPLAPTVELLPNTGLGGYGRGTWRATDWLHAELLATTTWRSFSAGAGARLRFGSLQLGAQLQFPLVFRTEAGPAVLLELGWKVPARPEDPDVIEWLRAE